MWTKALGDFGEERAALYLRRRGYRIVERNFRCRQGQIDLIAEDKATGTIVFVEVKTRTEGGLGRPAEAVDANKQRFLRLAAEQWLSENDARDCSARFDVIEVLLPEGAVNRIENAF